MIITELEVMSAAAQNALSMYGDKFRRVARERMEAHGQQYINDLSTKRMSGRPGVNRRTGNLARSWRSRLYESPLLGGIVIDINPEGPGSEYASLQEFGGTVVPKKSRYLWIPIAGNLTPTGAARITPREAIDRGGFFAKGVFFGKAITQRGIPQRSQHLGGAGYKGKVIARGENITPLFVLKKSVTVPGRLGARVLWAQSGPALTRSIDSAARQAGTEAGL